MRRAGGRASAAAIAALAVLSLAEASAAGAQPPPPADLEVQGGDGWRSVDAFNLSWRIPPPPPGGGAVSDVRYLVRDPLGGVSIAERRIGWPAEHLDNLRVPGGPGGYTAEVWLEDAAGAVGAPATVKLRYDSTRPGAMQPLASAGWVGRAGFPLAVHLSHPAAPPPPAGIRGYAVSVDRSAESSPCGAADRCSDAETDLRGGEDDDTVLLEDLPEGTSYVHAVAVSGSGMRSAKVGHSLIRVDRTDPVTRLAGAPATWVNHPVRVTATATDAASGMLGAGPGAPFTAIRVDDGAPVTAAGDSVATTVIDSGSHTVAYYARDAAGNVDDGARSNGWLDPAPRTAPVRIDREPPSVAFLAAQSPSDPEAIVAEVSDRLSGPDPERGQISFRAAGSGDLFDPLPTRGGGGSLETRWNSDLLPEGDYELRVTGYDRAGNSATSGRRVGGSPMIIHSPLKAPVTLSASLAPGRGSARLVHLPYEAGSTLSGRLLAVPATPLSGLPIRIVERFAPGPGPTERSSLVTTGPDGRFGFHLPPGPSREVLAQFAGDRTLTRAASPPVELEVRAAPRLSVSSGLAVVGGPPIEFRGSVPATGFPPDGAAVQLQFRLPGGSWREFRTVRTDSRGRFRYRYRFSDDDSRGVRFLFRAFVPAQGDWPYEPGGSRPVAVRGR